MTDPLPTQGPIRAADPNPPSRGRTIVILAAVVGALVLSAIAAHGIGDVLARGAATGDSAAVAGGPYTFTITGDGTADVVASEDGGMSQQTSVQLPYDGTVPAGVRILSVSGALNGTDSGSGISCQILDSAGTVVRQAASSGDYATVNCAASLDR